MKVIVENKKQYLADVKEMIDATKRLNEITKAAADELERLNAAREKADTMSLKKRVEELERQMAEIKQISTYEFGVVSIEWVARKLAEHLKEAASSADGIRVTVDPDRQAP